MSTKFEFKELPEHFHNDMDFWYDITDGGYINPQDILKDEKQIEQVNNAIELLETFKTQLFKVINVRDKTIRNHEKQRFLKMSKRT